MCWDVGIPSRLREENPPQTQPPVETKEKEYLQRLSRRGSTVLLCPVLTHLSSLRVFMEYFGLGAKSARHHLENLKLLLHT